MKESGSPIAAPSIILTTVLPAAVLPSSLTSIIAL